MVTSKFQLQSASSCKHGMFKIKVTVYHEFSVVAKPIIQICHVWLEIKWHGHIQKLSLPCV